MSDTIDANNVPDAVKEAFAKLFPEAEATQWEMEAEYEVEFEKDGKEVEVNFAPDGTLLQVEYEIDVEELPEAVVKAVKAKFPNCEIEEAERVELPDGQIFYELDLEFEIHVTPEGDIVAVGKDL